MPVKITILVYAGLWIIVMIKTNIFLIAKILLFVIISLTLAVVLYLRQPLFGALPQNEYAARIQQSKNYVNGEFINQIDTPLMTTEQSQVSLMLSNLLSKGETRPPRAIPVNKTLINTLDITQDMVIWLGHSSYYLQLGGKRILLDPVFSVNASPVPYTNLAFDGTSLYSAADMPEIDVLLITHDHYDHLDYPTILALQPKVNQVITGLGTGAHFEHWGYDMERVHEMDWNESRELAEGITLHATPARHFSGRTFTKNQALWLGFVLITPQRRLFFSGDTGYGPHFAELGQQFGPFDWVTLDMGQYDPRWANVHMNPEQAAQAAEDLQAKALTPGHVGRFSISPHDWDDPFIRIVAASQYHKYELWTPTIGQPVYFDGRDQQFNAWW